MTNKQKGRGTTPTSAVELKEAALDQASGGGFSGNDDLSLTSKISPGASKIAQKVWGDPH